MDKPSTGTHKEKVVLTWDGSKGCTRPHLRWWICLPAELSTLHFYKSRALNLDPSLPEAKGLGWVGSNLEIPVGKSYHPHPGELQSSGCYGDERVGGLRWGLAGGSDKAGAPS